MEPLFLLANNTNVVIIVQYRAIMRDLFIPLCKNMDDNYTGILFLF